MKEAVKLVKMMQRVKHKVRVSWEALTAKDLRNTVRTLYQELRWKKVFQLCNLGTRDYIIIYVIVMIFLNTKDSRMNVQALVNYPSLIGICYKYSCESHPCYVYHLELLRMQKLKSLHIVHAVTLKLGTPTKRVWNSSQHPLAQPPAL